MRKPPPSTQLDIFSDSRDTMLRNDVVQALERHDAGAATAAWQRLQKILPGDAGLAPLATLIAALASLTATGFVDHDDARSTQQTMDHAVEPAALQILGHEAGRAWLLPLWHALVQRSAQLPYQSADSGLFAAALWLRAFDWQAASDAVRTIPSWRRVPKPLAWMTEAHYHLYGLPATWPLLTELAWLAPARFAALAQRLGDPTLDKLQRDFNAQFEPDATPESAVQAAQQTVADGVEPGDSGGSADWAWFPAWVLTDSPNLAPQLDTAQAGQQRAPELAMRCLLALLRLARQGACRGWGGGPPPPPRQAPRQLARDH